MRNLLILLLGAAVIWLFIERNRLTDELAAAKTELETAQKKVEEMESAGGSQRAGGRPGAAPGKANWLNEHINRSSRALDTPKDRH